MMPTFDKEVLVTIEKIIGIPFIAELYLDGSVCFANNDEVRPEFRQHFNVFHVLDYVNASICKSELPLKTDFIKIQYPQDSISFWKQVAVGATLRKSNLLEQSVIENYSEIKWHSK
ncbi:hypothetical protein LPB87_18470 [Flavobacterium sp. EDS]|uniref:hypothetical protein n=1 Tax=Flavobacterium sp. EDS TaxID=2897328 RepID=UPI001E44C911|nr:hypothetical protein [Flavobacterium sp. EDS]MCD0476381.1 hypothetical protein [Flavobacterium sp. EDS]